MSLGRDTKKAVRPVVVSPETDPKRTYSDILDELSVAEKAMNKLNNIAREAGIWSGSEEFVSTWGIHQLREAARKRYARNDPPFPVLPSDTAELSPVSISTPSELAREEFITASEEAARALNTLRDVINSKFGEDIFRLHLIPPERILELAAKMQQ